MCLQNKQEMLLPCLSNIYKNLQEAPLFTSAVSAIPAVQICFYSMFSFPEKPEIPLQGL